MKKNNNLDRLIELLGEIVDISEIDNIDNKSVLGEDISIDSRDMLRFISRIESYYNFRFEPQDILAIKSLGDIMKIIDKHIQ